MKNDSKKRPFVGVRYLRVDNRRQAASYPQGTVWQHRFTCEILNE